VPEDGDWPGTLCALLKEMISQWHTAQFPDKAKRSRKTPPQGAYADLERAAGLDPKTVSTLLTKVFERNTSESNAERSRNGWPVVIKMIEICVPAPERQDWTERLAWLWMDSESGGKERPPGYIGRLSAADGHMLPALSSSQQTDRADLKVPLLLLQAHTLQADLNRLRESQRRSCDAQRRHDLSRQRRGQQHHDDLVAAETRQHQLEQELDSSQRRLDEARAAIAELSHLVDMHERTLADQTSLRETQQQLFRLVQQMLDAQARQLQWTEKLTADRDRLAAERDAAFRVAADEAAQRRSAERELVAARAHIDQLAAEVGALTLRVGELSAPTARREYANAGSRPLVDPFVTSDSPAIRHDGPPPPIPMFSEAGETASVQFSSADEIEEIGAYNPGSPPRPAQAPTGAGSDDAATAKNARKWDLRWWGQLACVLLAVSFVFGMMFASIAISDRETAREATFPVMDAVVIDSDSDGFGANGAETTYDLAVTDPRNGDHFDSAFTLDDQGNGDGLSKGQAVQVRVDPADHDHAVPVDLPPAHIARLGTAWKSLAAGTAVLVVVALSAIRRNRAQLPREIRQQS
jgi:hypothetical protein